MSRTNIFSIKNLKLGDLITIIFLNILSLLNIIFSNRIDASWAIILSNTLITLFILALAGYAKDKKGLIKIIKDWYWYPFILVIFKEIYVIIQSLHLQDRDNVLIILDRMIFGIDPTHWLQQFSTPILTEFLQICYSSFYLILFIVPFWSYIKKKDHEFSYSYFLILFGFYISYIGYLLVPAIGPRFTLHNFSLTETDLPGLFFTPFFRSMINMGESIPTDILNPAFAAQRDCFPSGHTEMTLISIYLSFKFKQNIRWVVLILGIGLIIGTVYLRYHYVIDIIGGVVCACLVIMISPWFKKCWIKYISRQN